MKFKLISLFIFLSFFSAKAQSFDEQAYKLNRMLNLIKTFYVDTVDEPKLVEEAITAMLKKLDPHSIYISKKEVQRMNEPLQGGFDGIGVQFNIFKDTLMVVGVIAGGPSEKLGIKAGDRIIIIDGDTVAGIGLQNSTVIKKLRGKKGTKVVVDILRRGVKKLLRFDITRDKIPIYSLDAAYMVDKKTAYIKLNRFAATSMKEFYKATDSLKRKGLKNIILDLRGNGGGYLRTAINLADEFLEKGEMVVYTEGTHQARQDYKATARGDFEKGRLVILVDEGSASASEIVSGAIQDHDRGVIIGRRTFSKGLVQRPFNLPDGSMVRLTVAHYYTPSGRCIQKPYNKGIKEYSRDVWNRYKNGELTNKDSIHFDEKLKYKTLKSKRTVYGGGGIMPDIFIPLDTTRLTDYYTKLRRKGILYQYTLDYIDKKRDSLLKAYPSFAKFKTSFVVTDAMLNTIKKTAEEKKILPKDTAEYQESINEIQLIIKSLIARDLWTTSNFYEIINVDDEVLKKAIEIISDKKKYEKQLRD